MAPPTFIQTPAEEYDFIVCGGGTAGNTVAGRLAEIPGVSVLVIEAGKPSYGVKAISTPGLATLLVESEYDWQYQATLIDRPDFKRVENAVIRGKSTTVNTTSKPSLLPITLTNLGSSGPVKLRIVDPAPLGDAVVKD